MRLLKPFRDLRMQRLKLHLYRLWCHRGEFAYILRVRISVLMYKSIALKRGSVLNLFHGMHSLTS